MTQTLNSLGNLSNQGSTVGLHPYNDTLGRATSQIDKTPKGSETSENSYIVKTSKVLESLYIPKPTFDI